MLQIPHGAVKIQSLLRGSNADTSAWSTNRMSIT